MNMTDLTTDNMPAAQAPQDDEAARLQRAYQRADARLAIMQKAGTLGQIDQAIRQRRKLQDPSDPTSDQAFNDRAELSQMEGQDGAGVVERTARAASLGAAKAAFETKDFVMGEPSQAEKSDIRKSFEAQDRALGEISAGYSLTSGVSQMVTGLIGAGKLMAPLKIAKYSRPASEVAKGAAAGAVVLDPHEERLSNLIESFPDLQNPVTEYLAAKPTDSAAEGRFKNALESIGADLMLVGAVKAFKYLRAGKTAEAAKEITALEKAQAANKQAFGLPEAPSVGSEVRAPQKSAEPNARPQVEPETVAVETPQQVPPASAAQQAADRAGSSPKATDESVSAPSGDILTAPGPKPFDVTPDAVGSILKGTAAEMDAIKQYGSRQAAAEAGAALSRGARLPWQKLTGPEEVQVFLDNAAASLKAQMDAAKGGAVLTDKALRDKVGSMADFFGEHPDLFMGQLAEAGQNASQMVARMEAGYLTANAMTQDAFTTATKIRNGILDDWGGDAVRAQEALRTQIKTAMNLLAAAKAISSNSGRALRRMRGSFQLTPEDLARVDKLDGRQLADLLHTTNGDPKLLAQAVNPSFLSRATDEATFLLQNNLLWNYPTHIWNMAGSALMVVGRPTEKLLGSVAIGGQAGSILRRQALKEYAATVSALGDGWTALVETFKRGDSILAPHNTEYHGNGGITLPPLTWKPIRSITDLAENAFAAANYRTLIGLPTRSLGAVDEFFKTLRYRAVVQADAAVEAESRGLAGSDLKAFVESRLADAIDPSTGQARNARALREAQITTFQQDLIEGSVGSTVQMVRSRHPILGLVLPFVKTPINALRYGWKLTPGLNLVQQEFRDALRGLSGPEAQAQAVGQMTLGSMFMGLAATLALNGKITGAGPSDLEARKHLEATGWKPLSFVLEDAKGNKQFVPMGRLDQVGMAFSMAATLTEALRFDQDGMASSEHGTGIQALGVALAKNFSDRTFLANINQALQVLTSPEKRAGGLLADTAGNLIPASGLLKAGNPDPYLRDAQGFIDRMLKTMPGYSSTLAPVRDAFGDPVARQMGLTTSSEADAVEAEHSRIILETGKSIGKPSFELEGVDLRDITLTKGKYAGRNAYDVLQELSGHLPGQPSLKATLAKIIKSQTYQDLVDGDPEIPGTRIRALSLTTDRYRKAAKMVFLQEHPELHSLIGARQREVRGAVLKKQAQRGQPGAAASAILQAISP